MTAVAVLCGRLICGVQPFCRPTAHTWAHMARATLLCSSSVGQGSFISLR